MLDGAIKRRDALTGGLAAIAPTAGSAQLSVRRSSDARLTFTGHAGFLVAPHGGGNILIDPFMIGTSVATEWMEPGAFAAILVTHGHSDHLDPSLAGILDRTGATLVASTPVAEHVKRLKPAIKYVEMNKGGTVTIAGTAITMVNAIHEAWIRDPSGKISVPHQGTGFVLKLDDGFTLYHAGDTDVFGDMELIGRLHRPDLAMLPIGGLHTMGPDGAGLAARLIGCRYVVPMHYGTFDFLSGTPAEFRKAVKRHDASARVIEMRPGSTIDLGGLAVPPKEFI